MTGLTAAHAAAEARRDAGTLTAEAAAAEAPPAETAPAVMPQPPPEVRMAGVRDRVENTWFHMVDTASQQVRRCQHLNPQTRPQCPRNPEP